MFWVPIVNLIIYIFLLFVWFFSPHPFISSRLAEKVEWAIHGPGRLYWDTYLWVIASVTGVRAGTLHWQNHWAVGAICPTMLRFYLELFGRGGERKMRGKAREREMYCSRKEHFLDKALQSTGGIKGSLTYYFETMTGCLMNHHM